MEATTITKTEPIIRPQDMRADWDKMSLFDRSKLFFEGQQLLEEDELTEEEFEIFLQ